MVARVTGSLFMKTIARERPELIRSMTLLLRWIFPQGQKACPVVANHGTSPPIMHP
jgi:hypothetical protein